MEGEIEEKRKVKAIVRDDFTEEPEQIFLCRLSRGIDKLDAELMLMEGGEDISRAVKLIKQKDEGLEQLFARMDIKNSEPVLLERVNEDPDRVLVVKRVDRDELRRRMQREEVEEAKWNRRRTMPKSTLAYFDQASNTKKAIDEEILGVQDFDSSRHLTNQLLCR